MPSANETAGEAILLPVDDQAQDARCRLEVENQFSHGSGAASPMGAEQAHPVRAACLDAGRQREMVTQM